MKLKITPVGPVIIAKNKVFLREIRNTSSLRNNREKFSRPIKFGNCKPLKSVRLNSAPPTIGRNINKKYKIKKGASIMYMGIQFFKISRFLAALKGCRLDALLNMLASVP